METRPVCRLLKSLYGLKQTPRQWNAKLSEALLKFGFMQSQHDHSLFIKESGEHIIIILVYVVDMLITGPTLTLIAEMKTKLQLTFKKKYLGDLKYFLGIEFARSQRATPIEANIKLTTKEYDEHTSSSNATDDEVLININQYQRLQGKQLYLTITRPDIAYSIHTLSMFMQKPKRLHLEATQRVVKYVKNQPGQAILLSSKQRNTITAYCNVDWATCPITRKSVTSFFIKYGDSLISWKSKKQSTIFRGSAESEYRSIASTIAELVILGLFKDIGIEVGLPINIYTDSKAAIQIAANLVFHNEPNTLK
uniref:Uncharacterized mitochondrial protein AtMg00810-like n=1 Tax=Nicotiana tabacum TaxID=4097 RepID=A0A1S4AYK4_TOBAC|nr:PREDICTED: uncharacterized mitochondrial protein AtMg00810-like [Nicotiana tabacum]